MIAGIGIDSVEVDRFADFEQIERIFSPEEIAYCQSQAPHKAERFAVRFAAREALFKALSHWQPAHTIPFLSLCKHVKVIKNERGVPHMIVDWAALLVYLPADCAPHNLIIHLSLTHTKSTATALIILEYSAS